MKNKLPVYLDNLELPKDNLKKEIYHNQNSYGYVSILTLISTLITLASLITVLIKSRW